MNWNRRSLLVAIAVISSILMASTLLHRTRVALGRASLVTASPRRVMSDEAPTQTPKISRKRREGVNEQQKEREPDVVPDSDSAPELELIRSIDEPPRSNPHPAAPNEDSTTSTLPPSPRHSSPEEKEASHEPPPGEQGVLEGGYWLQEHQRLVQHQLTLKSSFHGGKKQTAYTFPRIPSNSEWLATDAFNRDLVLFDRRDGFGHQQHSPATGKNRKGKISARSFKVTMSPTKLLEAQPVLSIPMVKWQPNLFRPNPDNSSACFKKFGRLSQEDTETGTNWTWSPELQKCVGCYSGKEMKSVDHWQKRASDAGGAQGEIKVHPLGNVIHGGNSPMQIMAQSWAIAEFGGVHEAIKQAHEDVLAIADAAAATQVGDPSSSLTFPERDSVSIVELGCGNGNLLFGICPPHPHVRCYGTDYSERMIQYSQAYFGHWIDLRHGIGAAHVVTGSSDLVLSNAVAMYLTGQQLCTHLAEGMRVLKPGGKMVLAALTPTDFSNRVSGNFFADPETAGEVLPAESDEEEMEELDPTLFGGPPRKRHKGKSNRTGELFWTRKKKKRRVLLPFCGATLRSLVQEVDVDRRRKFPVYSPMLSSGVSKFFLAALTRSKVKFCNKQNKPLQKLVQWPSADLQGEEMCPSQKDLEEFAAMHPVKASTAGAGSNFSSTSSPSQLAQSYMNLYEWYSHAKHNMKDKEQGRTRKWWTVSRDSAVDWIKRG